MYSWCRESTILQNCPSLSHCTFLSFFLFILCCTFSILDSLSFFRAHFLFPLLHQNFNSLLCWSRFWNSLLLPCLRCLMRLQKSKYIWRQFIMAQAPTPSTNHSKLFKYRSTHSPHFRSLLHIHTHTFSLSSLAVFRTHRFLMCIYEWFIGWKSIEAIQSMLRKIFHTINEYLMFLQIKPGYLALIWSTP